MTTHSERWAPLAGDPTVRRMSDRERETALLVADGLPDVAIARTLGVQPSTIRNYIRRVQMRLQLSGRDDIVAWVIARRNPDRPEHGLIRADAEHHREHTADVSRRTSVLVSDAYGRRSS